MKNLKQLASLATVLLAMLIFSQDIIAAKGKISNINMPNRSGRVIDMDTGEEYQWTIQGRNADLYAFSVGEEVTFDIECAGQSANSCRATNLEATPPPCPDCPGGSPGSGGGGF